jgi:hypothetical protein
MRVCHNLSAGFDDPNLVSCAGLIPVMTLAERAGLHDLARAHVRVPGSARIARSARRLRLHLSERWPWEHAWQAMFTAASGPPIPAT